MSYKANPMITEHTKQMIPKIREYMEAKPVAKAWIFGSCSRGEETADSDVDILVAFVEGARVSLFTMGGMYADLKELLNREIDLVEDGTLLPFAVESAERDKILIYERA